MPPSAFFGRSSLYSRRHGFESLTHAMRTIGDWIRFCNHQRPHQVLKMKTPAEVYALTA
ncbi:integrase core domain-containing protein [Luteibacter sp. E-22]|uniref:integrase core domain-containing protein n=1 Tax=Luteibacter sp. E-22 TaxID=3404050 RepID=UPI003CEA644A